MLQVQQIFLNSQIIGSSGYWNDKKTISRPQDDKILLNSLIILRYAPLFNIPETC